LQGSGEAAGTGAGNDNVSLRNDGRLPPRLFKGSTAIAADFIRLSAQGNSPAPVEVPNLALNFIVPEALIFRAWAAETC